MIGLVRITLPDLKERMADADDAGVVCRLRRIQSSRYEIGLQMQVTAAVETTYTSLVSSLR